MDIIEIIGIPLKLVIIIFGIKGVIDTIIWLRNHKDYSYAWVKIASAIVLGLASITYVYLLVRTFIPMSQSENYWIGAVPIRILMTLYTVVVATGANVRNIHRR
jgi:GH15 family glucan-1,4-alpha-glucosidase